MGVKLKKSILYLIILLVLSLIVFANGYVINYGGMGTGTDISVNGYKKSAYSSPYASHHNLSSKFLCEISDNPTFQPLIKDLNNDLRNEIIVSTTSNFINVYDFNCGLVTSLNFGETIQSVPAFVPVKSGKSILAVLGTTVIKFYDLNSNNTLVLDGYINTVHSSEVGLTCDDASVGVDNGFPNQAVCMAYTTSNNMSKYIIYYNSTDSTYRSVNNNFATTPREFYEEYTGYASGYANAKTTGSPIYPVWTESVPVSVPFVGFKLYDQNLQVYTGCNMTTANSNAVTESGTDLYLLLSSIGSSTTINVFGFSGILKKNAQADTNFYALCDSSGAIKVSGQKTVNNGMSNFACGDWNIDGLNECCFVDDYNASEQRFKCYDAAFTMITNVSFPTSTNQRISLAEFNSSNSYMEIVSADGIFQYDGSSINSLYDVSLYTADPFASVMTAIKDSNNNNYGVVQTGTNIVIFGYDPTTDLYCGDGSCDGTENMINCEVDCAPVVENLTSDLLVVGSSCVVNEDCVTGFCAFGSCTYLSSGDSCNADYECGSGVCGINDKCTKESLANNLNNLKTSLFGSDTTTNNIIALFVSVSLGVTVAVILAGVGGMMAAMGGLILTFYSCLIITMMIGWLSAWLFVIFMILAIIIGMGLYFLNINV